MVEPDNDEVFPDGLADNINDFAMLNVDASSSLEEESPGDGEGDANENVLDRDAGEETDKQVDANASGIEGKNYYSTDAVPDKEDDDEIHRRPTIKAESLGEADFLAVKSEMHYFRPVAGKITFFSWILPPTKNKRRLRYIALAFFFILIGFLLNMIITLGGLLLASRCYDFSIAEISLLDLCSSSNLPMSLMLHMRFPTFKSMSFDYLNVTVFILNLSEEKPIWKHEFTDVTFYGWNYMNALISEELVMLSTEYPIPDVLNETVNWEFKILVDYSFKLKSFLIPGSYQSSLEPIFISYMQNESIEYNIERIRFYPQNDSSLYTKAVIALVNPLPPYVKLKIPQMNMTLLLDSSQEDSRVSQLQLQKLASLYFNSYSFHKDDPLGLWVRVDESDLSGISSFVNELAKNGNQSIHINADRHSKCFIEQWLTKNRMRFSFSVSSLLSASNDVLLERDSVGKLSSSVKSSSRSAASRKKVKGQQRVIVSEKPIANKSDHVHDRPMLHVHLSDINGPGTGDGPNIMIIWDIWLSTDFMATFRPDFPSPNVCGHLPVIDLLAVVRLHELEDTHVNDSSLNRSPSVASVINALKADDEQHRQAHNDTAFSAVTIRLISADEGTDNCETGYMKFRTVLSVSSLRYFTAILHRALSLNLPSTLNSSGSFGGSSSMPRPILSIFNLSISNISDNVESIVLSGMKQGNVMSKILSLFKYVLPLKDFRGHLIGFESFFDTDTPPPIASPLHTVQNYKLKLSVASNESSILAKGQVELSDTCAYPGDRIRISWSDMALSWFLPTTTNYDGASCGFEILQVNFTAGGFYVATAYAKLLYLIHNGSLNISIESRRQPFKLMKLREPCEVVTDSNISSGLDASFMASFEEFVRNVIQANNPPPIDLIFHLQMRGGAFNIPLQIPWRAMKYAGFDNSMLFNYFSADQIKWVSWNHNIFQFLYPLTKLSIPQYVMEPLSGVTLSLVVELPPLSFYIGRIDSSSFNVPSSSLITGNWTQLCRVRLYPMRYNFLWSETKWLNIEATIPSMSLTMGDASVPFMVTDVNVDVVTKVVEDIILDTKLYVIGLYPPQNFASSSVHSPLDVDDSTSSRSFLTQLLSITLAVSLNPLQPAFPGLDLSTALSVPCVPAAKMTDNKSPVDVNIALSSTSQNILNLLVDVQLPKPPGYSPEEATDKNGLKDRGTLTQFLFPMIFEWSSLWFALEKESEGVKLTIDIPGSRLSLRRSASMGCDGLATSTSLDDDSSLSFKVNATLTWDLKETYSSSSKIKRFIDGIVKLLDPSKAVDEDEVNRTFYGFRFNASMQESSSIKGMSHTEHSMASFHPSAMTLSTFLRFVIKTITTSPNYQNFTSFFYEGLGFSGEIQPINDENEVITIPCLVPSICPNGYGKTKAPKFSFELKIFSIIRNLVDLLALSLQKVLGRIELSLYPSLLRVRFTQVGSVSLICQMTGVEFFAVAIPEVEFVEESSLHYNLTEEAVENIKLTKNGNAAGSYYNTSIAINMSSDFASMSKFLQSYILYGDYPDRPVSFTMPFPSFHLLKSVYMSPITVRTTTDGMPYYNLLSALIGSRCAEIDERILETLPPLVKLTSELKLLDLDSTLLQLECEVAINPGFRNIAIDMLGDTLINIIYRSVSVCRVLIKRRKFGALNDNVAVIVTIDRSSNSEIITEFLTKHFIMKALPLDVEIFVGERLKMAMSMELAHDPSVLPTAVEVGDPDWTETFQGLTTNVDIMIPYTFRNQQDIILDYYYFNAKIDFLLLYLKHYAEQGESRTSPNMGKIVKVHENVTHCIQNASQLECLRTNRLPFVQLLPRTNSTVWMPFSLVDIGVGGVELISSVAGQGLCVNVTGSVYVALQKNLTSDPFFLYVEFQVPYALNSHLDPCHDEFRCTPESGPASAFVPLDRSTYPSQVSKYDLIYDRPLVHRDVLFVAFPFELVFDLSVPSSLFDTTSISFGFSSSVDDWMSNRKDFSVVIEMNVDSSRSFIARADMLKFLINGIDVRSTHTNMTLYPYRYESIPLNDLIDQTVHIRVAYDAWKRIIKMSLTRPNSSLSFDMFFTVDLSKIFPLGEAYLFFRASSALDWYFPSVQYSVEKVEFKRAKPLWKEGIITYSKSIPAVIEENYQYYYHTFDSCRRPYSYASKHYNWTFEICRWNNEMSKNIDLLEEFWNDDPTLPSHSNPSAFFHSHIARLTSPSAVVDHSVISSSPMNDTWAHDGVIPFNWTSKESGLFAVFACAYPLYRSTEDKTTTCGLAGRIYVTAF